MLGEDELAALGPARAGLAQFAQHRIDLAPGVAIEGEATVAVVQAIRNQGEHGPPVSGRACGGARCGHRVAVPEQQGIRPGDDLGLGFGAAYLTKTGHGDQASIGRVALIGLWLTSSRPKTLVVAANSSMIPLGSVK